MLIKTLPGIKVVETTGIFEDRHHVDTPHGVVFKYLDWITQFKNYLPKREQTNYLLWGTYNLFVQERQNVSYDSSTKTIFNWKGVLCQSNIHILFAQCPP